MESLMNISESDILQSIPARFHAAITAIQQLAAHDRYQAAFIFGSVARGDSTNLSDLDVKVIVDQDNPCPNINHPFIDGVKLDLTFTSLSQLEAATQRDVERAERVPMLAESLIVFDKTGKLATLRSFARQARPKPFTAADHQLVQLLIFHANNKAQSFLNSDPCVALLVMHMSLNEVLDIHYWIRGRWRVSSKRLLQDVRIWDRELALLLETFVTTTEVHAKFTVWHDIIEHVLHPLGGRQPISENNCHCEVCRVDLANISPWKNVD
jgi:predicted nucleotidyltransferase